MIKIIIFTFMALATICHAAAMEQMLGNCNKAAAEGNFSEALQHAATAISQSSSSRPIFLCQARAYNGLNDHAHALEALQMADKLSQSPLDHAVTLILIGNKNIELHDFDKALDNFSSSLAITRKIGNKHFEMVNLNQIGEALLGKNDHSSALDSYLNAQKLAANDNERADCSERIAAAYTASGNHDKAIEYQIKAMLMEERSGDFDHFANASLELGKFYLDAKQYANAEKTLNRTLEKIRQVEDLYWEAKADYYLALTKKSQGDTQAASTLLDNAKKISEKIGARDLLDLISR